MFTGFSFVVFALLAALLSTTIVQAGVKPAHTQVTTLSELQNQWANGEITVDAYAVEVIRAIKTPLTTFSGHEVDSVTNETAHCITAAIVQIYQSWDSLSRTTQSLVTSALTRQTTDSTYLSPSGFFTLHYDLTGLNAVPAVDLDASNIPDFIERAAAYMDTSLAYHRSAGFLDPPSDGALGGDSTFDVYFEDIGGYGYAVPEGPGPNAWPDAYSHLVLHNTFVGFSPNNDPEGDVAGAAKATCAHEFHHCVQFAYDPNEALWLMELDATVTEDFVFDATDDNYNYLNSYFRDPEISLSATTIHQYSSFIWHSYLAQRYDTSLLLQLWNGARTGDAFQSSADSLLAFHGVTRDSAFTEFVSWLYKTGSRNDGNGFEEGSAYPLVQIDRTHSSFPATLQTSPKSPAGYASCWVEAVTAGQPGNLQINFDGDNARQWSAIVILTQGANQHTILSIPIGSPNYSGSITIDSMSQYSRITLAGVNLSEGSAAANFTYSFTPTYTVNIFASAFDSSAYAGTTHPMKIRVRNFLSSPQVVRANFSDLQGWVASDSATIFVDANDSTNFVIPVTAPFQIPLGSQSLVNVAVRSLNDTAQFLPFTFHATTVAKRGDLNFDGEIDLIDLTVCVSYLFLGGGEPVPSIEAGDMDCLDGVDLVDLTLLVNFLFISFEPSPCQPD